MYRRPSIKRNIRRIPPVHSKDRFNAEALGGRLWHSDCQEASKSDLSGEIPLEFDSIDEYISIFDPLVMEETREGFKADWAENCAAGNIWRVQILSVEDKENGWYAVKIKIVDRPLQAFKAMEQNMSAVLSLGRPSTRNPIEWAQSLVRPDHGTNSDRRDEKTKNNDEPEGDTRHDTSTFMGTSPKRCLDDGDHRGNGDGAHHKGEASMIPTKRYKQAQKTASNAIVQHSRHALRADSDHYDKDSNNNNNSRAVTATPPPFPVSHPSHQSHHRQTMIDPRAQIVAGLLDGIRDKTLQSRDIAILMIHPECAYHRSAEHRQKEKKVGLSGINGIAGQPQQQQLRRVVAASTRTTTAAGLAIVPLSSSKAAHAASAPSTASTAVGQSPSLSSGDCCCCVKVLEALRNENLSQGWTLSLSTLLVSAERESYALHEMRNIDSTLLQCMLHPGMLSRIGKSYDFEARCTLWPKEATESFTEKMVETFDGAQLEAIEMTSCHLGKSEIEPPTMSVPATTPALSNRHQLPAQESIPALPFILIQGPPGTGKTHTVRGILNVWHFVAYHRYYDAVSESIQKNGLFNIIQSLSNTSVSRSSTVTRKKPRILVCTPSNAACDELMTRVMLHGFYDGKGRIYRPNIIRVSAMETSVSSSVYPRLLPVLVQEYSNMTHAVWQSKCEEIGCKISQAITEARIMEESLQGQRMSLEVAQSLVKNVDHVSGLRHELDCLQVASKLIWKNNNNDKARNQAYNELEALLLSEANMVFTTLSSTQRKAFQTVARDMPFRTVLIDEAGQSSEVAALQPLIYGAKQVVLVGDPQQLPATIKSEAAKAVAMERSLFERLQKMGCPVVMLTEQYRMHEEIRKFPSKHFYEDKLVDSESVRMLAAETYHSHEWMRPYLVFDVAKGTEKREGVSGSVSNEAEAEMAAGLCWLLWQHLKKQNRELVPIAVITPYREQKKLLRQIFEMTFDADILRRISIETIDSYQGKQMDVVILSCVRAGPSGGLGFVNDVRRMNVGITRARRSLWVLGALNTLRGNKEWEALVQDAEERHCIVHEAHAEDMFPELEYWSKKEQAQQVQEEVRRQRQQARHQQHPTQRRRHHHPNRGGGARGRTSCEQSRANTPSISAQDMIPSREKPSGSKYSNEDGKGGPQQHKQEEEEGEALSPVFIDCGPSEGEQEQKNNGSSKFPQLPTRR